MMGKHSGGSKAFFTVTAVKTRLRYNLMLMNLILAKRTIKMPQLGL